MSNRMFATTLIIAVTISIPFLAQCQPAWDEKLDFKDIEHRLSTEKVIKRTSIRAFLKKQGKTAAGTHPVDIVELESGLLGVFKRENACYGEVAAYKVSCALGLRLVPPTVLRKIDGIQGSLQFYVDSSIDLMRGAGALRKISPKDTSDMNLFYFVAGQWDDHNGNQIVAKNNDRYQLALIDNGGILRRQYARYGNATYLQKGTFKNASSSAKADRSLNSTIDAKEFPFDKSTTVSLYNPRDLAKLEEYLPTAYIQKLKAQRRSVSYILWNSMVFIKFATPPVAKTYYSSTIHALKKLDRRTLEEAWADYMPLDSERCNDLIDLMLSRKDQVVEAATKSGTIVNDRK